MIKNNLKTLSIFLLAFLTYLSFIKSDIIVSYNILSFVFFLLLVILYKRYLYKITTYSKISLILASIFSILIIFGRTLYAYYNIYNVNVWQEIFCIRSIIYLLGLIPLFYIIIHTIVEFLCSYSNKYNEKYNHKLFIVFSMLLMLGVWSIYLLTYYPGTLSPDSLSEYSMFVNGLHITSDHHPVLHILFMSLFYNLGFKIFGTANSGVLFVSIAQMIVMASIFTYSLTFLRKRNCPKILVYALLAFYSFSSITGYYSIVMWKDVLFAGFLLLLTIECYKLFENKDNLTFKKLISFLIVSLITVFLRNNAIYAYFILASAILIVLKRWRKQFSIIFAVVFLTFIFVKGPVFKWCGIQKSSSAEYIGMPLQQVARVITKGEKLSQKQYDLINELIPVDVIPITYNPVVSDGIKFNKNFNVNVFNDNKFEYLKLYMNVLINHFPTATEAYLISTLGYWYPNVNYWSVANNIYENKLDIYTDSKTNDFIKKIIVEGESRSLPLFGMQWSIGLCVWIISILTVCFVKKYKWVGIIPFLPCIGIWLTMLIASPVWGEFRYVYGLFTSLPFLIGIFFLKNKTDN